MFSFSIDIDTIIYGIAIIAIVIFGGGKLLDMIGVGND